MAKLHSEGISKIRKIGGYVLSILPCMLIVFSGTMKIIGHPMMMENMAKINLEAHTPFIGALEISCVLLYWIPKTSNLGFFLLCSYTGGIIASEMAMSGGSLPFLGILVATLIYVGTFLRKPELTGFNL